MTCEKTLNYCFKDLQFKNAAVKFFILSNFDKQEKTQLLAKFKKIVYIEFRVTVPLLTCS